MPPFVVLLGLYVVLLRVGPSLPDNQYCSAVAGLALLIGVTATGWRTLRWKRLPRIGSITTEKEWLRLDHAQACTALVEAIGDVLVRRDFRRWVDAGEGGAVTSSDAGTGEAAVVGSLLRVRDKVVDKLAEALAIAAGASIVAALPRIGLPAGP